MFTLEIDGVAVAVINGNEEVARDLFTCDGFKEDIRTMTSKGRPVWNGTSALKIRAATAEEVETFEEALSEDDAEDDAAYEPDPRAGTDAQDDEDEDEADIVFLVDIDEDELDS